jgi:branched-chain amino acid transport system substrate-binding protein
VEDESDVVSRVLRVGIPVSLSGQFRVQGQQALAGLQAWAEDVNRSGGICVSGAGYSLPVSIIYHDDASSRDRVRQVTEQLIVSDKVDLLMGPYSSVLSQASAEVAEGHRTVFWNQGGASDSIYQQGYHWVVGILTPASEYLTGLFPMVKEIAPQAQTLAIVRSSAGSFPKAVSEGAGRRAEQLGFKVVLRCEYPPDTTDFSAIINEVSQAQPDVLLAVGRIQNDLLLACQMAQSRLSLGVAAVVAAPVQQFHDVLGTQAKGFVGPSQWEPGAGYAVDYGPSEQQVLKSLRRQGNYSIDYPMVQAYAAGVVVQRCIEEAGTLDQRALREAASKLDFSTFYGRFKIDPDTGRQTGRSVVIVQWQEGRKVVVWPPEQRQAQLRYPWRVSE